LTLSIVIPAYRSEQTIVRCLETFLAQDVAAEIIVVDSSPDQLSAGLASAIPGITVLTSAVRLLPHAARNVGVGASTGDLLLFSDPDIYPESGAVTSLLSAWDTSGGAIAAALMPAGDGYLERGLHLTKFDLWLPGGAPREIDIAPTCGLLCTREAWERVGGFRDDLMLGDTVFSNALRSSGVSIHLEPRAVFLHDHVGTWRGLLAERYARGRELGGLRRASRGAWPAVAWDVLATITLVRPVRVSLRSIANAWRAGLRRDALLTSPVVATGQLAWFAGEIAGILGSPEGTKR
jgi:GT2 family glycosyltransferase